MYIIMPNKPPNIRNAYKYPNNTKENYNTLVNAIKLLGLEAAAPYIQNHTPPIPKPSRPKSASNSRASIAKKARPAVGTWRVKGNNGITTGENFRKSDGTPYTVINQKGLNLQKELRKLQRKKTKTAPQVRKLPAALLQRFKGEAPKNLSRSSRNSHRGNYVVLTVR